MLFATTYDKRECFWTLKNILFIVQIDGVTSYIFKIETNIYLLDERADSQSDDREIFLGGVYSMLIYLQMIETPQDKSKFEAIYEEYYGLMYHTAYKYLKHEQDAEDAVHYAFVKIAENIKIVAPVSPKTKQFVVTIVENRVIDIFRVRSKHPEVAFMEELYIVPEQPENDNYLKQCIRQLPTIQRQVIWLKYYYGYNLHEIAKMLDISLSWAQKIDQRAKKKLREIYAEGGQYL